MNRSFNIAVVGGGMTGLTAAALLAQSPNAKRLNIHLVDAGPRVEFDRKSEVALRVSAISHGSAAIFDRVGVWQNVLGTRVCAYDHMRVWDEADEPDGPSTLRFDADEFAAAHLGHIVENLLIQSELAEVLDDTTVELRFDSPIASLEPGDRRQSLVFESGDRLEVDLVIAADGARSRIREAVGIGLVSRPYAQTAFVTHLRPERPHGNTAWQRFLRDGPLGMLPLADGRISVVWSTTPEQARAATELGDVELGEALTRVSDGVLGDLEVAGPRGAFPLAAQHAEHYVQRGIALIGDAAHTIHPLAGQGANLGLADAEALAAAIDMAIERGEHPADRPALRRYERARKGANTTMMHFMTGLNRLFASDSAVLGELRRAGMALFNRSGPVRERVVGVALGAGRR